MNMPSYPFEATEEQLQINIEHYIDGFINSLQSFFMVMPRGSDFLEFARFQKAYDTLSEHTEDFHDFSEQAALSATQEDPLVLVVLRTILGLSPPELAFIASLSSTVDISQGDARRLDKRARQGLSLFARTSSTTQSKVKALVTTAVDLISKGSPRVNKSVIHRLDKFDTADGLMTVQEAAQKGASYAVVLYERLLGRPFATHRDSVSELVGDVLEQALANKLRGRSIPCYQPRAAERFEDMDQAPDFFIPEKVSPRVILEAKLAEDDGTARDKVTRVQHLAELRDIRARSGTSTFEVVACVDGRGFGIRREDVRKLLLATKGKLFNLETVEHIVDHTSLKDFVTQ